MAIAEILNSQKILRMYSEKGAGFWAAKQKQNIFSLFKKVSAEVPAYKKFLKEHRVNAGKIRSADSLNKIPPVTKANYFKKFKFKDLLWPEYLQSQSLVMTSTSGSTGVPAYFSRTHAIDMQYSILAEMFLRNGKKGSTLLVDCFSMGVWIGGLITYQAFRYAGLRGYPVTIIAPGINKKEIFNALRALAPDFDNVILSGYPPFIKDLLDEARLHGIDLNQSNYRFLFAAESFTENFRDYVVEKAGCENVCKDTLNIYGTAELGAMAFETPTSIFIRRLALRHPEVYKSLFSHPHKIPTLAQYNPMFVAFEEQDGQVLITANNSQPFMRYSIGDSGGVLDLQKISKAFSAHGINLADEARRAGIELFNLPFVYVYERSDLSTTLYGLQVYPQTVKMALEHRSLADYFTGKFSMITSYDKKHNQVLEIHLETKPGLKVNKKSLAAAEKKIIETLLETNSEYRELSKMLPAHRTRPRLTVWEFNHPKYFMPGVKQKWHIK